MRGCRRSPSPGRRGGSASALRARLEGDGHAVIGVDVRDAEVVADLGTLEGRRAMVDQVTERSGGALHGVVAAAGVTHDDGALVTSVNFFGALATLEGLRPLLAGQPGASRGRGGVQLGHHPARALARPRGRLPRRRRAGGPRRGRPRRRGLRRQQAGAGPLGAAGGHRGRVDRRRCPPQRRRPRLHRHPDDGRLPRLHPRPRRRLPDPGRTSGTSGGGGRRSSPTSSRTTPASSAARCSPWTAAPTPPCAPTTGPPPSPDRETACGVCHTSRAH